MPPVKGKRQARSHEENRKVVCALCFQKKGVRLLTRGQEQKIQELDPGFSTVKHFLPTGICNACRLSLSVRILSQKLNFHHSLFFCRILILTLQENHQCVLSMEMSEVQHQSPGQGWTRLVTVQCAKQPRSTFHLAQVLVPSNYLSS